jgi:hypothetical protein
MAGVRFSTGARDISLLHGANADSEAHPVSYSIDTAGFLPGDVNLTTHLHLVLRSRQVELYLYSLIRLHGVVFN